MRRDSISEAPSSLADWHEVVAGINSWLGGVLDASVAVRDHVSA